MGMTSAIYHPFLIDFTSNPFAMRCRIIDHHDYLRVPTLDALRRGDVLREFNTPLSLQTPPFFFVAELLCK